MITPSNAGRMVPVAHYSTCEIAWYREEQPLVAIVPATATVPVFQAGTVAL